MTPLARQPAHTRIHRLAAIDKALAVVELELDGAIVAANQNFLTATGYTLDEIAGRNHSMFIDPSERDIAADRTLWETMRRGEASTAEFRRIGKGGREIWICGSYTPLLDKRGKPYRVVMLAADLTTAKRKAAEAQSQLDAISRTQAVILFELDGTIVHANDNFLKAMGYALDEIKGRHHSMFVEPAERDSAAYRGFWDSLRRGEATSAEFRRIGKSGQDVWIHGSYNPLLDAQGKPFRVMKFATDITPAKQKAAETQGQLDAINRSQAVIVFELDGTIVHANDNFLKAMGYALDEIKGRHHSMFVEPAERDSPAYRGFWDSLRRGEYQAAEYKRLGKGGREVRILASYNPILDSKGRPFRVVKFATDVTAQSKKEEIQRHLDAGLRGMAEAIARVSDQALRGSAAASQTASNVQSVASAAEELSASISEISGQVSQASDISRGAVSEAERSRTIISSLSDSAQKIGAVVAMISDIAEQTNLLALNATIEAARAGEAGKGFAVVASEVKALATQSAKATEDISAQISRIQGATGEAVTAVTSIADVISKIADISTAIASSVEEQSAVTGEITSNMQTAATGVDSITQGMSEIAAATEQMNDSAKRLTAASASLG